MEARKQTVELSSKEAKKNFSMSKRQVHVDKVEVTRQPSNGQSAAAAGPTRKKLMDRRKARAKEPEYEEKPSGGRNAAFYALMAGHSHLIPTNVAGDTEEEK